MSEINQPAHARPGRPGDSPYMWEKVECSGKVFYVPLNRDLKPMSDFAIQDVQEVSGGDVTTSDSLLLVRDAEACARHRNAPERVEETVVRAIRTILESGDATTYQVCEALIARLTLSEFGKGLSVDVAGLLHDNFWFYEVPSTGGYMIRQWTLNQERANAYWKAQKKNNQPRPVIFPPFTMYN